MLGSVIVYSLLCWLLSVIFAFFTSCEGKKERKIEMNQLVKKRRKEGREEGRGEAIYQLRFGTLLGGDQGRVVQRPQR